MGGGSNPGFKTQRPGFQLLNCWVAMDNSLPLASPWLSPLSEIETPTWPSWKERRVSVEGKGEGSGVRQARLLNYTPP